MSQEPKFVIAVDDNWTGAEVLKKKKWYHDRQYKKLNYEIADMRNVSSVQEIVIKAETALKQMVEVAQGLPDTVN